MPVMKSQLAPPAMKEAIVLDLGDLGAQAARIREQAARQAEDLLESARAEAAALVADAQAKAEQRGFAEGLAKGTAEGMEQGRAQALSDAAQKLEHLTEAWSQAATAFDEQRQTLDREAREAVLIFALRTAEKIVHRSIEVDPGVVVRQVEAALEAVLWPHDVSVCIHPEDRPAVEEALPQLTAKFGALGRVSLVEDAEIGRGGCVLKTMGGTAGAAAGGQIDATIQTQLDRLAELLLPGGPAEPSAADAVMATDETPPEPVAEPSDTVGGPSIDGEPNDAAPPEETM